MNEITLEKVEQVRERSFVTYGEAKEALENANGDVLEALIYIENKQRREFQEKQSAVNENNIASEQTIEDIKVWIKDIVKKGNVSRIKIKKDDKVLADIPANAGIAASAIAILLPPVLAVGVIAAVATNLVFEITKVDGSVEIVNKIVKKAASDIKDKAKNVAEDMREKASEIKESIDEKKASVIDDGTIYKAHSVDNETNYTYTVKFDETDK